MFKENSLFKAVDRLQINAQEHVILNFGIDIQLVNHKIKHEGLAKDSYRGIRIITVEYINRNLIRSSLVIIKKTDLPQFVYPEADPGRIERSRLESLRPAIGLYGQVIDLHGEPQLMELFAGENDNVLKRSVYLVLDLKLEVRWKQGIRMTELRLYSEFYQQGLPNDLNEIEPFNSDK